MKLFLFVLVYAAPFFGVVGFFLSLFVFEVSFWYSVLIGVSVAVLINLTYRISTRDWRAVREIAVAPFQMLIGLLIVFVLLLVAAVFSPLLAPLIDPFLPSSSDRALCDRYRCR